MSKNCTDEEREMYEKNLKEAQDYFTKASQEYTKAGGAIGENFFKSMSSKLTSWQFESVGSYMIQGIANGAEGNKVTLMQKLGKIMNEAFSSVYSMGLRERLQAILQRHHHHIRRLTLQRWSSQERTDWIP